MSLSIRLRCGLALALWATLLGACNDDSRDGGVIVGDDGAVEGGIGISTTGATTGATTGQTTGQTTGGTTSSTGTTGATGGTTAATTGAPPPTPPGPTTA